MPTPFDNFNPNSAEANLQTPDHPRHRQMLEPLISFYQDGEVSSAERLTVERYLATCAECRRLLMGYNQVETQLQIYLKELPAPKSLRPFSQNNQARLVGRDLSNSLEIDKHPTRHWFTPVVAGRLGGVVAAMLVLVSLFSLVLVYRNNETATQVPTSVAAVSATTPESSATPNPSPLPSATPTPLPTEEPTPIPLPTIELSATPLPANLPPLTQIVSNNNLSSATATRLTRPVPTNTLRPPLPSTITTSDLVTPGPTATKMATSLPTLTSGLAVSPLATTTAVSTTDTFAPITTTAVSTTDTFAPITSTATLAINTPLPGSNDPMPTTTVNTPVVSPTRSPTPSLVMMNVPGWIAYVSNQDSEIHLITSDGSNDVTLSKDSITNGEKWEELIWSHDAKWVAAVAQNSTTSGHTIYIFNVAERNVSKLNFVAEGFAPVWSPNDLSMAFLAEPLKTKDGLKMGKPSVVNLKKRFVQPPITLNDEYQALAPQWFEDGTRLLVGSNLLVATDGTLLTTLTLPYENSCVAPSLSPFGNKLAVMEQNGPVIYDLNKGSLDKSKPLAVNLPGKVGYQCGAYRLRWTPSGRSIYFYANKGGVDTTCVVSAGNSGASCLAGIYEPGFTIDGGHLVDFDPDARGQFYALAFGNKPANPHILGFSKVPPVWEPIWS